MSGPDGTSPTDSGVPPTDGAADTYTAPMDGPVPPQDAPVSNEGGPEGGTLDAGMLGDGSTPYVGKIVFEQLLQGTSTYSYVSADFASAGAGLRPAFACPPGSVTSGACCYGVGAAEDAGSPAPVSAGTIDIFDDVTMAATMPYAQGYAELTFPYDLWLPDDYVKAIAAGATVQGFMLGLQSPEAPQGMMPAGTATVSVSVGSDWAVTWTAGAAGSHVLGTLQTSSHALVQCMGDDSSGTMTFPAALLGHLPAGQMGTLNFGRLAFASANAPNAYVEMALLMGQWVNVQFTP